MNRHFQDARYYLNRAAHATAMGLREEFEPVEVRLRAVTGREPEPEPTATRLEHIREEFEARERRAEREAREAITEARSKLSRYRQQLAH